mmetsp:Transcript_19847/g.50462  ORF Transcript_19847/g.50462 Transcript_19847/m.50462 type:complete len:242 (-) Transcript_19847:501-1226(-)
MARDCGAKCLQGVLSCVQRRGDHSESSSVQPFNAGISHPVHSMGRGIQHLLHHHVHSPGLRLPVGEVVPGGQLTYGALVVLKGLEPVHMHNLRQVRSGHHEIRKRISDRLRLRQLLSETIHPLPVPVHGPGQILHSQGRLVDPQKVRGLGTAVDHLIGHQRHAAEQVTRPTSDVPAHDVHGKAAAHHPQPEQDVKDSRPLPLPGLRGPRIRALPTAHKSTTTAPAASHAAADPIQEGCACG